MPDVPSRPDAPSSAVPWSEAAPRPAHESAPPAERPRRGPAVGVGLLLVLLGAGVIASLVVVFLHTARGQQAEQIVMSAMATDPRTDRVFLRGLDLVSEGAVALAILSVLVVGAIRRRLDLGVGAAALVAGANVTTQILKYGVLERTDFGGTTDNTLPSGHVTVITSILVAVAVVLPARWRPLLVPLVAFFSAGAGVGTIILHWHRPSDVVAAYAVVLAWVGLVVVGLAAAGRVRRRVPGTGARAAGYALWAALAVGLVGTLILVAGVAPTYSRRDMGIAVLALAAVALACAAAVALASYAIDLLGDRTAGPPPRPPARR